MWSRIEEWLQQPRNFAVLVAAIALCWWGSGRYFTWSHDRAVAGIVAQAAAIARQKINPLLVQFELEQRRLPRDNSELRLPPAEDASWNPFQRVELHYNGDIRFEFADPDTGVSGATLVWRLRPPPAQPAPCGAYGIVTAALEKNGLQCDHHTDRPPALPEEPASAGEDKAVYPVPKRMSAPADRVMAAVGHDSQSALQKLRGEGIDICAADPEGRLPLAEAARSNQLKALAALAAAPCGLNQVEPFSRHTALMIAVMLRNLEAVRLLLGAGADPNFATDGGARAWLLLGGSADPESARIREALRVHGADLNTAAADGGTLLMAAADSGSLELANWLLKNGANPDLQDKSGRSALMYATLAAEGESVLRLLISYQANVNLRDAEGHTALALSRLIPDPERQNVFIRLLMQAGGKT